MNENFKMFLLLLFALPAIKAAVPGTFFWKPRLSLDLAVPTTEASLSVRTPTIDNIREGLVVMIDGYAVGMTVIALAAGITSGGTYPYLNPLSGFFYTTAYRWFLRYISMLPKWLSGSGGNLVETTRVWRRRFYYMDEFVPTWAQKLLFFVPQEDWDRELLMFKRFKKFSEGAFGKHYRYPSKVFKDFESQFTVETVEGADISSDSMEEKLKEKH